MWIVAITISIICVIIIKVVHRHHYCNNLINVICLRDDRVCSRAQYNVTDVTTGESKAAAQCCRATLSRQLADSVVFEPVDWSKNAAGLSVYYTAKGNYKWVVQLCWQCLSDAKLDLSHLLSSVIYLKMLHHQLLDNWNPILKAYISISIYSVFTRAQFNVSYCGLVHSNKIKKFTVIIRVKLVNLLFSLRHQSHR